MRFICVLAMPRTGSSHLNKLLKSIPQINAKSELFHAQIQGAFSRRELEEFEKRGAPAQDRGTFNPWRRQHPVETLEAIYQGGRKRIVAFKLFPNHLKRPDLKSAFFPREDMGFVILRRRPIECYISGVKAREAGKFTRIDTTAIKPGLSVEDFLEWGKRMRRWYDWFAEELAARGRPFGEVSYEKHLDGRPGGESLAYILPMLRSLGFDTLTMPHEVIEGERQDQEPRFQERISNWVAFETEMRERGHDGMLDWALEEG
jgi:hypothetical protein